MNKYSLQKTWSSRTLDGYHSSANKSLADCKAASLPLAIEKLSKHCPVKLNGNGYAKKDSISYCVAIGI